MERINQVFLQELKQYINNNYKEDCKYGYGWLLERGQEIENLWCENKIAAEEYEKIKTNYETILCLIDEAAKNKNPVNECS